MTSSVGSFTVRVTVNGERLDAETFETDYKAAVWAHNAMRRHLGDPQAKAIRVRVMDDSTGQVTGDLWLKRSGI